jgi:hypothetical protein
MKQVVRNFWSCDGVAVLYLSGCTIHGQVLTVSIPSCYVQRQCDAESERACPFCERRRKITSAYLTSRTSHSRPNLPAIHGSSHSSRHLKRTADVEALRRSVPRETGQAVWAVAITNSEASLIKNSTFRSVSTRSMHDDFQQADQPGIHSCAETTMVHLIVQVLDHLISALSVVRSLSSFVRTQTTDQAVMELPQLPAPVHFGRAASASGRQTRVVEKGRGW